MASFMMFRTKRKALNEKTTFNQRNPHIFHEPKLDHRPARPDPSSGRSFSSGVRFQGVPIRSLLGWPCARREARKMSLTRAATRCKCTAAHFGRVFAQCNNAGRWRVSYTRLGRPLERPHPEDAGSGGDRSVRLVRGIGEIGGSAIYGPEKSRCTVRLSC